MGHFASAAKQGYGLKKQYPPPVGDVIMEYNQPVYNDEIVFAWIVMRYIVQRRKIIHYPYVAKW